MKKKYQSMVAFGLVGSFDPRLLQSLNGFY